jgi:hypothetical protein
MYEIVLGRGSVAPERLRGGVRGTRKVERGVRGTRKVERGSVAPERLRGGPWHQKG